ncbi:MAG: hypothetical protein SFW63_00690 [Alphaproteobacteria bacterium]|nr:hypothetical protein [Alphaproteobacteria bacterium]
MALPDLETAHTHAMKLVKNILRDDRANDALPEGLEDALKNIAALRLSPDTENRFDSYYADMAKGKLKADQGIVDDIGSRLKIDQIVDIYDNAITEMLKANGYGTGRGAA